MFELYDRPLLASVRRLKLWPNSQRSAFRPRTLRKIIEPSAGKHRQKGTKFNNIVVFCQGF